MDLEDAGVLGGGLTERVDVAEDGHVIVAVEELAGLLTGTREAGLATSGQCQLPSALAEGRTLFEVEEGTGAGWVDHCGA